MPENYTFTYQAIKFTDVIQSIQDMDNIPFRLQLALSIL